MSTRLNARRRAACGAMLGSLLVLLGACSNKVSGGTTTTTKPTAKPTTTGVPRALPPPGTIFAINAGARGGGTGNGSISAYLPSATGDARPILEITDGVNGPGSVTFDSSGNLWVVNSNSIVEYSKSDLTKASPTPVVVISSPSFNNSLDAVSFDHAGDAWVAIGSTGVVEFTRSQLAKSGSPTPVVTINDGSLCSSVFDRAGNMWAGGPASVFEFTKSQLAKSGSPIPRVVISMSSQNSPCRPAFAPSGDMWGAGLTAYEFTKAQLARSGSPTPRVTISSALAAPGDVAVDALGDLWVPNAGTGADFEFTKSQLARSGSPAPAKTISGPATGLNWPWAVTVEP
jgi:ligand-binding sensor domain-containing protein